MDAPSAKHASDPSTTDDTERHIHDFETLSIDTDQTASTYEVLGYAISDDAAFPPSTQWDAAEASSTMPGGHGGLKPWPDIHSPTRDNHSRNDSPSHLKEQASAATLRSHYDSKHQPLTISQQTSASSVRDMALRKGSPAVLRKGEKPDSRPLKSALKRYPSQHREQAAVPRFLYPPEHEQPPAQPQKAPSRFSLFGNLFSRRNSSNKSGSSPQVSRTSSTTSAASSHHAAPAGPRHKRSIGWEKPLHQYNSSVRSESVQSNRSDVVRQAKLAEGDVYEKAKMNIRRPPKGIQNWFDGVDVSSDEDDDLTPVELPVQEALPSTFSTFGAKKQDGRRSQIEQQRSKLSKAERLLGQKTGIARFAQDEIDDHLVPQQHDPGHRELDDSYFDRAATPKASAQMRQQQRRYNNESALSMHSSMDGTETDHSGRDHYDSDIAYGLATSMNVHRPQIPPRRLQPSQIASHNAYFNERPRLITQNSNSRYSNRSHDYRDEYEDRPQTSSRKSSNRTTSDTPRSRGRASTRLSSLHDQEDGGVLLDINSPEISHMMAVTDEEMALLEMMRNKRAAMQKNSYSEGYRQALKREHEQLVRSRMMAQQTAMRILASQHDQELARRRQELEVNDEDEKQIRKLNKLRQQELDRMKRLDKFLAMDTSLAAALDDAGIPQDDDLVQNWPLPKQEALRSPEGRSRNRASTPSFSRRDVYDENTNRTQLDRRNRSNTNDSMLAAAFPNPPEVSTRRYTHDSEANLVRFENGNSQTRVKRQSTQSHTKHESTYREEQYTMGSHTVRPKKSQQLSRQQMQAATFLRSISDYQGAEEHSVTSQGSASVSASIVSPMTPSSTGAGHGGKLSAFDGDEVDYLDRSSPELTFSKSHGAQARTKKHLPSALAILAESDKSSYRGSTHSNNSAGEDVLAAWASLGGAEGMLPARRTRGV